MAKWKDKLNRKDLNHLKDSGANTLTSVKLNLAHQSTEAFPCWDCVNIGRKLNLPFKLTAFHEFHGRDI